MACFFVQKRTVNDVASRGSLHPFEVVHDMRPRSIISKKQSELCESVLRPPIIATGS